VAEDRIILVDSNYLCHYAMHRFRGYQYNGNGTGVVFGFLKQLLVLSRQLESTRFVFVWDSKESLRKLHYPNYKAKRRKDKTPEELEELKDCFWQFHELRTTVLPKFGFENIFHQSGYEADDLIAVICQDYPKEEIAIVSSDHDLHQLLTANHYIYDNTKKKKFTQDDFLDSWALAPRDWALVKSIAGCTTDNVEGIKGVGDTKAVQYVRGVLPERYQVYKRIISEKGQDIIHRNRFLVELPFLGTKHIKLQDDDDFYSRDFLDICEQYGFVSFEREEQKWADQFKMKRRKS